MTSTKALSIYSQLICMGFADNVSLEAANKFSSNLNDAISYIIETQEEVSTEMDCSGTVASCPAIKRIITALSPLQNKQHQDDDDKYGLINDYHHVLINHLCDDDQFHLIYIETCKTIQCDIANCYSYHRNNRNRKNDVFNAAQSIHKSICSDILDTLHCYLVHSYDVGFRLNRTEIETKYNLHRNDDSELKTNQYVDEEMVRLKRYLFDKRKHLRNVRGTERMKNNKFSTNIKIESNSEESKGNVNAIDESEDCQYSFGQKMSYWDPPPEDETREHFWFIEPKYKTLKEEITANSIDPLDMNLYIKTCQKAQAFLDHSHVIRSMKSTKNEIYGIHSDLPLNLSNLMSIIFYTDYDTLSYNFSRTFRRISSSDKASELKERNREFRNWSRLLIETVHCYGTGVKQAHINVFYHGVSLVYFDRFMANLCGPTSTTTQLQIAAIFAQNDGLILELMHCQKTNPTFFNCALLSSFGNEDERLFVGANGILEFRSIRLMSNLDEDYTQIVCALKKFNTLIAGYTQNCTESECRIITNIINEELGLSTNNDELKYPIYITKCFRKFCNEEKYKEVTVNVKDTKQNASSLYDTLFCDECDNLLCVYKLNMLFNKLVWIRCKEFGAITSDYFVILHKMLQKIRKLDFSELHEILLIGITNIDYCDGQEFAKYQALFKEIDWEFEVHNEEQCKALRIKWEFM
eukprot:2567_1